MFPSSTTALTDASSVQELHVALLAFPNELQSRISFHTYRTDVCHRQPHRLRRLCSDNALLSDRSEALGSSRIDSDLHDLLHHVNCLHLLNLQSTFGEIQHAALVAPIRMRRPTCLLQTFARLSLGNLDDPVLTIFTNFVDPIKSIFTNFTEAITSIFACQYLDRHIFFFLKLILNDPLPSYFSILL